MSFKLATYIKPDFSEQRFVDAPDATLVKAPCDKAAPDGFHATSIFPEYFKIGGKWHLAEDSRMDAVPIWDGGKIRVVEFRNIRKGELVVVGRTEDASEGIYVHDNCWQKEGEDDTKNTFAFRQSRSRETSFTQDYKDVVELLKYEKEHNGYVVWVLGHCLQLRCRSKTCNGRADCTGLLSGTFGRKCTGNARLGRRISGNCSGM